MDMQKMLKEMQKMQGKVAKTQAELAAQSYEAEAGGGAVKVSLNGNGLITSIKIAPIAVDKDDIEGLEDTVQAAINAVLKKKEAASQEAMGGIPKGLKSPGM
jgi:DNA-binding YbaB/EbfC family protein